MTDRSAPSTVARSMGDFALVIPPTITDATPRPPQLHATLCYFDEPVPNLNRRADLTAADQSRDLADNECPHGHLPGDPRISCDCYELARIRRHADELDADELDDELLRIAAHADDDRGGPHDPADLERQPATT